MSDRDCSVPGCGHVHDVQCLLMSIASGGTLRVRAHQVNGRWVRSSDDSCWVQVDGEWTREVDERPGVWAELQTTIARLSKSSGGSSSVGKASERPVPYDEQASRVAHRLRNELSTWARLIADQRPDLPLPVDDPPAIARWVAVGVTAVFVSAELSSGIRGAVRDAERVIDRAPDKVYAGPCWEPLEVDGENEPAEANEEAEPPRCEGQLYAEVGKERVGCRECGAVHDVATRQEWLTRELDGQLVSAAEAAPVLSWLLDKKVTRNHINNWKLNGRVEVHDGHWPYRFGDLLVLAREMKPRGRGKERIGGMSEERRIAQLIEALPDVAVTLEGRLLDEDPWADAWSEYRSIFDGFGLTQGEARALVDAALAIASTLGVAADADAVADALKEFVVLCRDRRGESADLRAGLVSAVGHLRSAVDEDERRASAVFLFGTCGEVLHPVLAELPVDLWRRHL